MQSHALAQGFHAQHLAQKFVIHIAFWHIAFWIIKMELSNRPFDLENTIVQTPHNVTFRRKILTNHKDQSLHIVAMVSHP